MTALRPGRPADLDRIVELWRRQVQSRERDSIPTGAYLERMLAGFDWEERSRVAEVASELEGAVLLTERPGSGGSIARLEDAAGPRELRRRLVEWGVAAGRLMGAEVVQVWRRRGCAEAGLDALGLANARPFWRMDRRHLTGIPVAPLPPGYRVVSEADGLFSDEQWVAVYNGAFAEHWRFTPRTEEQAALRRGMPDRHPELYLMAASPDGIPVATVWCAIESYIDDARPQPVGIVGVVGTMPAHRRRGLAAALTAEGLRRLHAKGAASASLYVDGLNPTRAYEIYRGLGFEVAFEYEVWERELR